MPFANGENVGAYRVVEKLGHGGMATVFKAYHPSLDRYVAIKVMHPALTGDPNFLARFQREARIVAKLDHPHIVPIYDFAQHRGHPYLVMRFVEGETLKAYMQRGSLELAEVLRIARAVGGSLAYAHERGVMHRDIKPSNILLTPDGGVYLTDFGLARMAEAGESTLSRDVMVGTPQYISPEQAKGVKELDARTDIYSLGVVLYEMIVGRPPFAADTPYAVIHDHIFTPLPLPGALRADLPEPVERVLLKALAKEPDDRFQSVEELVNALDAALKPAPAPEAAPSPAETVVVSSETIVVPSPAAPTSAEAVEKPEAKPKVRKEKKEPKKKKRGWLWVVAGVAVLFFVVILGLVVINQWQQAEVPPDTEQAEVPPGSEDAEQLLEEARAAGGEGDFGRALELCEQAIETDPHLISAYMDVSGLLIKMGDVDRAIDILMQGLEANPESQELHKRAAGIALLTERWGTAEKESRWLLQEMPEDALSHAFAAALMLAQGHPCEEARPELDTALLLDPDLAWAHYGLALCHLQEGNPETARAELEFVLVQDDTPALLRMRAEQRLDMLGTGEMGEKESIEQEFEALFAMAGEIPDQNLREPFKEMLDQAREAWTSGDEEAVAQMLKEAHGLVRENWDGFGEPLAGELDSRLDHIIRMVTEPGPP